MNKKQVIKFLIFVFVSAYAIQIVASILAIKNPGGTRQILFTILLMILMYTPFFGALFAKGNFKGINFIPRFKKVAWLIPLCWFGPAIIASLGGALFFLIFPDMFDLTGSYIASTLPEGLDLEQQLKSMGLSLNLLTFIQIIQAISYAPLINMFLALGEEVGWRGFLYPELNKSMGKVPTWIVGGLIWGAFHFPIIILVGYEYGTEYFGHPYIGLIVFSVFTVALGLLEEVVYDKSKCIWYPSLLHGAVNAGSIAVLFTNVNNVERFGKLQILGPFYNGAIGGIPLLILSIIIAVIVLKKKGAKSEEVTEA